MEPKVVRLRMDKVELAPYNPRKISQADRAKLKKSLEEFGYVDLMIWNKRTNYVVGGNQRFIVMKEDMGVEEADFIEVDLPLEREKLLNVALNKIGGDWDYQRLTVLFNSIEEDGALPLTGFDSDEISVLIGQLNQEVPIPTMPELPTETNADKTESYVVLCTFKTREGADRWCQDTLGIHYNDKGHTKIVDMEKLFKRPEE